MTAQERMREQEEQRKVLEARKLWDEFNLPKGTHAAANGFLGVGCHIPLCIITFGLWIPVWIISSAALGKQRKIRQAKFEEYKRMSYYDGMK